MQTALSKEQHEELTEEVEAVSELLFVQLAGVYKNLEKKLKRELDVFYDQKILELIELKKSLTKVLIVDEIKAEKKKKDDGGIVNIIDVEEESSKGKEKLQKKKRRERKKE